jgi:hypothetical protein
MKSSRRSFLAAAAAGPAIPLLTARGAPGNKKAVEAEIRRRAAHHLGQRYLVADYYLSAGSSPFRCQSGTCPSRIFRCQGSAAPIPGRPG